MAAFHGSVAYDGHLWLMFGLVELEHLAPVHRSYRHQPQMDVINLTRVWSGYMAGQSFCPKKHVY